MAESDEAYSPNIVVVVQTNSENQQKLPPQTWPKQLIAKKAKVHSTKEVGFPNNFVLLLQL
jgi:hypothetical protein